MASSINLCDENKKLVYKIHRCSSYSNNYFPENILIDCPSDQASRWSANTNHPPQYLVLKLNRPAIVRTIKFGKFERNHVCNIKKFCIYGGMDEDRLTLLLEGGLRNDHVPETFNLRCRTEDDDADLPILYLKIVPLLSWSPTFNFSIWFIELHGQDDPMYTNTSLTTYNKLREIEIVKLCLKHFRQQGYYGAYRALQAQTQVRLEHPHLSELHKSLVYDGDFQRAEEIITNCIDEGFLDDYLNRQDYKHSWRCQQIFETNMQPGNRGGHQMVMNAQKRLIYLYGGWDGYQDLSDLWAFNITTSTWNILCEQSELCNGPTPRSCHKMVFDPISGNIFMIGRYLDNSIRTTEYIKSDFFLYDTISSTWMQICDDTSKVGGPQLVFDHQMCIDVDKRTIYIFGGKILTPRSVNQTCSSSEAEYSGLFSYHIATNTWTQILVDCHHPSASLADMPSIKSRVTHCMVFHNKHRKLYVYGGQRGKEEIDDFFSYDVDTQVVTILNRDGNANEIRNEPSSGNTLRATIDCDRDEIYVFSSLCKQKDRRDTQSLDAANSFWVYSLTNNKWSHIYTRRLNGAGADTSAFATDETDESVEPCPRYAHQLVYDDVARLHYLFGGNPAKPKSPQLRLDDFWILQLEKPKRDEVFNQCRFLIRKLRYEEMTRENPLKAMEYLREDVAAVVDHNNKEQLNNFHKLASLLFKTEDERSEESLLITPPLIGARVLLKEEQNDEDSFQLCNLNSIEDEDIANRNESATTPNRLYADKKPNVGSFECFGAAASAAGDTSTDSTSTLSTSTASIQAHFNASGNLNQNFMAGDASNNNSLSDASLPSLDNKQSARQDQLHKLRSQRAFLFNKLVQLMPQKYVQPERNLSDFIVM